MPKQFKLTDANGNIYLSDTPGEYGGNGKLKVYGSLDCGTTLASMRRFPGEYQKHRIFFADEKTALAAGFRPCGNCLRAKYKEYIVYEKEFRRVSVDDFIGDAHYQDDSPYLSELYPI